MPKQDYPIYAIRRYRLNLDEATAFHKVNFRGDFLWAIESSNKTVTANVRIGDVSADAVPIRYGTQFDGLQFNELWFEWAAQPGEWIDLVVAETNGRLEARNAVAYEVDVGGVVQTVPAVQNQAGTFLADQRFTVNVRANFIPQSITRNSYTQIDQDPFPVAAGNDIAAYYYRDGVHYWVNTPGGSFASARLKGHNKLGQLVHDVDIVVPSGWTKANAYIDTMVWDEISQSFLVGVRKSSSERGVSTLSLGGTLSNFDAKFPVNSSIVNAITATDSYVILTRGGNNQVLVYDRNGTIVSTIVAPTVVSYGSTSSLFVRDNILWTKGGNANPVDAFNLSDFSVFASASPFSSITNRWASYDPKSDLAFAHAEIGSFAYGSTWGWSYTSPGYVTVERECTSLRLAKPDRYIIRTSPEFSGGKIYGEVIRAALDAYFAPRIVGDDYLDHVFEAEFLGEGIKVSGGFTSLARAGVADAFSVRYPVNARLVIDSNMPLSTISGV